MYLKYIELYGFKSFANRTKIELYPGINIIVGPNGCGKSNIVDAIKWSIGEMSRKALRMPSMTDVIFAGTSKRQPMNLAEVTLVFDNTERKLPILFDEVAITRKIYRSEESEYFINRVSCRLKDIKDMFLDTGIGSNGYAIIDQGEIEEILLADAIERREVFEEVAGISRYKAKREETLAKLEKIGVDLSIVENSVALIEQQIRKLEQDAKKAKLQKQYQEELREAEIVLTVKTIYELYTKVEEERNKLNPILSEISDINSEISQLEAEKSTKDIELTDKINDEKEISEKIISTKLEISQVEGKIINNEGLIKEIKSQLAYISERHKKNLILKDELLPKIAKLKDEFNLVSNEEKGVDEEYSRIFKDYESLEVKIRDLDLKIAENEKRTLEGYQNEISISNSLARLESELAHLNDDIFSALKDKEKLSNELNDIVGKLEEVNSKLSSLKNQMDENLNKISELKLKKDNFHKELEKLIAENDALSLEIVSLETKLESLIREAQKDSYWVGTQAIISASFDGVFGVLRNLINFKGKRVVLEDMLGEAIDSIVVRERDVALRCIEYLKENSKGRARFLILSNLPPFIPSNSVVDDLFEASADIKNLLNYLLKDFTVEGTTIVSDILVCGGVDEATSNEPYWSEIDEIRKTLEDKKHTFKANEEKIGSINKEISNLSSSISYLEEIIKEGEKEIAVLSSVVENIESRKVVVNDSINFIKEELEKLNAKRNDIQNTIQALRLELSNVQNATLDIRDYISSLKNEKAILEKELIEKKELLSSVKHKKDLLLQRLSSIDEAIKSFENQLNEIENQEKEYTFSTQDMSRRIEDLTNEINKLRGRREELLNDLKEYEIERKKLEDTINEIRNYLSHVLTTIKENNEVLKEKLEKKSEIELTINTYSIRIEDLKNKLEMEYAISYDEIKDKYKDFEVDPKRVEYLKKRIENIGPVNMAAPQEYEQLMKEYNDKMSQINDLKKAKEDLKEAIAKINQTTKEGLKTTFDKVNEHFKKIYTTLFNGGTANLIFTDPDNILESGIEIMACPPGKKLVNISQLSGGEKSLTAIALLFSFFCVNPSPFCVMDEVDAALDESNVERFVNLLKEFSPSTQFIVITHNKRTMEVGDRIYGVTMEELGVSKVISVDLKRAISMIEKAEAKV